MPHPVRLGTCGWSYKDWAGVFYPPGLPAAEYLPFYAERYSVVEVDSTFYHSPSPKTVEGVPFLLVGYAYTVSDRVRNFTWDEATTGIAALDQIAVAPRR